MERGISKTFVLSDDKGQSVIGYFTLSASEISHDSLPTSIGKRMPNKMGVVLLGRLAVGLSHQGKGIGLVLIHEAVRRTVAAAEHIGICGMLVKAKDEKAASFYEHYGFVRGDSSDLLLFLPIETLRQTV